VEEETYTAQEAAPILRTTERIAPGHIIQQSRILESATRRYLATIRELARVRKLQAKTPAVQQNVQINLDNVR
jgi:hypothetical protein